jgi:hypothetical protein
MRPIYPVFLFVRRPGGNGLAGRLYFNSFGRRPKLRDRREITEIITYLAGEARGGRIAADGVVAGWPGLGHRPANAADIADDEIMRPWIARAFTVSLRVDLHSEPPPFSHDAQVARMYVVGP